MKNYTESEMEQKAMYGETVNEMRAMAGDFRLNDPMMLSMYAMGILSDVQHILAEDVQLRGTVPPKETARQWLNKAKYFMSLVSELTHPVNVAERKMAEAQAEVNEFNARREYLASVRHDKNRLW